MSTRFVLPVVMALALAAGACDKGGGNPLGPGGVNPPGTQLTFVSATANIEFGVIFKYFLTVSAAPGSQVTYRVDTYQNGQLVATGSRTATVGGYSQEGLNDIGFDASGRSRGGWTFKAYVEGATPLMREGSVPFN